MKNKYLVGLAALLFAMPLMAQQPEQVQPGTMAAKMAACTACHGEQGKAGPDGYYPRIAGKPADYLYNQLVHFRSGNRQYRPMQHLLENMPDDYLRQIAAWFSEQHPPYPDPRPSKQPPATLARGEQLVMRGDAQRGVPACVSCHGAALSGVLPAVPALLGLPHDYISSQFGAWTNGLRRATAPDCMADIARRMTPEDVAAVAGWLSSQPPRAIEPAASLPAPAPMRCGTDAPAASPAAPVASSPAGDAQMIDRGRYLARLGNCMGCHTQSGGEPYAGGRALATPFGTFHGPNLTPDAQHGLGAWSADDFWRALNQGKSRDGKLLYPAFPYPSYRNVTRADADALFAYLRSLPAVNQANKPHELAFPYNQRWLLGLWRAFHFRPGQTLPEPPAERSEAWVRGRYLVEGLAHCAECHTPRNRLGALAANSGLAGSLIEGQSWYAPPLTGDRATGLGDWTQQDIVDLLKTGIARSSHASGPMAEAVHQGFQYAEAGDLDAMAVYLKSLPAAGIDAAAAGVASASRGVMDAGGKLYAQQCAQCHGDDGKGKPPGWPPLAGNISVTAISPDNAIQMVLAGGFAPATAANPQPHGMPPFGQVLADQDVAAVVSYIRQSWGNRAGAVSLPEVRRVRELVR